MSTSLLYHAWGLRGYRHQRFNFRGGAIHLVVAQDPATFRCSHCGARAVGRAGVVERSFRGLPVGGKPVWIELAVPRLWCASCSKTRQATIAFADPKVSYR